MATNGGTCGGCASSLRALLSPATQARLTGAACNRARPPRAASPDDAARVPMHGQHEGVLLDTWTGNGDSTECVLDMRL